MVEGHPHYQLMMSHTNFQLERINKTIEFHYILADLIDAIVSSLWNAVI